MTFFARPRDNIFVSATVISQKQVPMATLNSLLFNINLPQREKPAPGKLLVAEPFLREDWFNHSVACIIDGGGMHQETLGVVLNRQMDNTLQAVLPDITRQEEVSLYCGGPVATDRLFFIHTLGNDIIPGARMLVEGLWLSGDFKAMASYVNAGYPLDGHIRFFVGYSGWSPGQLQGEIEEHTWAVASGSIVEPDQLLTGADNPFWHKVVRAMGPAYRGWLFHPLHPNVN